MADCPVCGEPLNTASESLEDDDIDSGFVNVYYECDTDNCPMKEKGEFYTSFNASGELYDDDNGDISSKDITEMTDEYEERKVLDGI